jgi:hypothetical protein
MPDVNPADLIDPKEQLDFYWARVYEYLAIIIRATGKSLDEFVGDLSDAHAVSDEKIKPMVETTTLHKILPRTISLWSMEDEYTDESGEAKEISVDGPEPSLKALMERAKIGIVDEKEPVEVTEAVTLLVKSGAVVLTEDGLSLKRPDFVYATDEALHPVSLVRSIAAFMGCVANNSKIGKETNILQAFAWSMSFPIKDIALFESTARDQGMQFLVEMDNVLENSDDVPKEERTFAGVGVYVYHDKV